MTDKQILVDLAAIWFDHAAAGMKGAEHIGWYYLMQATMEDLHP